MSKDDYFVIVYRLLKYLYGCLKSGKPAKYEVLCADFFGVEDSYWEYIIRNLYIDGYVDGMMLVSLIGKLDKGVKIFDNFMITPKGIEYLSENSIFQKVKGIVKDISPFIS